MTNFAHSRNNNYVSAFFAVKELIIPVVIDVVIITEAVSQ